MRPSLRQPPAPGHRGSHQVTRCRPGRPGFQPRSMWLTRASRLPSLRKHVSASRAPMAAGGTPLPPSRLLGAGGLAPLGAALLRYCRGVNVSKPRGARLTRQKRRRGGRVRTQRWCFRGPAAIVQPGSGDVALSLTGAKFPCRSFLLTPHRSNGHGPLSASEDGGREAKGLGRC